MSNRSARCLYTKLWLSHKNEKRKFNLLKEDNQYEKIVFQALSFATKRKWGTYVFTYFERKKKKCLNSQNELLVQNANSMVFSLCAKWDPFTPYIVISNNIYLAKKETVYPCLKMKFKQGPHFFLRLLFQVTTNLLVVVSFGYEISISKNCLKIGEFSQNCQYFFGFPLVNWSLPDSPYFSVVAFI